MSYVRNRHIDIIHTHQSNADVIGLLAGRILGRPVISTMHSIPENYRYERLHSRWLTRLTARYLASRFIAVSQSVRTRFIAQWHIPADQITTIYNTVPIEPYLWIPDGVCRHADGDGLVITNIGRLGTSKGQHILLEATSLVLRARPDARLMIVGHGRLEQQLKQHARDLGIFERVTFTGMRRDIPAVLAQSDIFVLSSLWEGLPLTAVEAMAAARPVVLSDVGGCRELIEPGVQGLIVPPGDAQALADALLSLANDRERRLAMGRAGRARVRQEFCMGIFVAQHEMLYRSIWKESHVAGHQGKHASLV